MKSNASQSLRLCNLLNSSIMMLMMLLNFMSLSAIINYNYILYTDNTTIRLYNTTHFNLKTFYCIFS